MASYTYTLTANAKVIRRSDGATIPAAGGNKDYQAYQKWVAAGNTATAAPAPTPAQQATAAINAGLAITSTSTPALNGTYPVNAPAQAQISAEVTAILLNGTFADGAATVVWFDTSNAQHTFTAAQFKTFASAVAAYVSGWMKFAAGIVTTAPTQPVTIP